MLDEGLMLARAREYVVLADGRGVEVRLVPRDVVILDAGLVLSEGLMLCMGVV